MHITDLFVRKTWSKAEHFEWGNSWFQYLLRVKDFDILQLCTLPSCEPVDEMTMVVGSN